MSKAKAEITIYHIIDILKVTRYYKLESSTNNAPSAPTTNPPSGWSITEPSYETGSTKTLYFVDLTEFTDGSFKYSAVSKSSSYEAAKAAYNKAVGAEKVATNYMKLESGGLVVGNHTGTELKGNVLIDTDSVDIRQGSNILASYQGKNIYLGKNSSESTIDLCDGTGEIRNDADYFVGSVDGDWRRLQVSSDNAVHITAPNEVNVGTHVEVENNDGSFSMHSSRMFMSSNMAWYEGTPDDGYAHFSSNYRKTTYNSGSSPSYYDDEKFVHLQPKADGLIIGNRVNFEDYNNSAEILLNGGKPGYTTSKADIMADQVSINDWLKTDNAVFTVNGNRLFGAVQNTNKYWGILTPEGYDSGWIRTTSSGLIPHTQDSTNGHGSLGTSSWPFGNVHASKINAANIYGFKNSEGAYKAINVNDVISLDSDGDIITPNGKGYHGKNSSGATRSLIYMNSNNNTVIGYGGYANNEGNTTVYGNSNVHLQSKGVINITSPTAKLTSRSLGVNNLLWSGTYYMSAGHTATLSEAISAQMNGIVLLWSLYKDGAAVNSDLNYTFIPKYHGIHFSGKGVCCFITTAGLGNATTKYVYVHDTKIVGHANNSGSDVDTASGITKSPNVFVLRFVIGV